MARACREYQRDRAIKESLESEAEAVRRRSQPATSSAPSHAAAHMFPDPAPHGNVDPTIECENGLWGAGCFPPSYAASLQRARNELRARSGSAEAGGGQADAMC